MAPNWIARKMMENTMAVSAIMPEATDVKMAIALPEAMGDRA